MARKPKIPDLDARMADPSRRGARITRCRHCRSWVLSGYDGDVCAVLAQTDHRPLSIIGEMAALLGDRKTYLLEAEPGRRSLKLTWRSARRITRIPAGSEVQDRMQADILAEHRCKAPPLPEDRRRLPDLPIEKEFDHGAPPPF